MSNFIPFFKPDISEEESELLIDVLKSGIISKGPKVFEFQDKISEFIGNSNMILTNSCTSALFLALKTLGIGKGDEVIVPSFTFCSTVNIIEHLEATPVFVDINYDTFLLDEDDVKRKLSNKTKAIIIVHFAGYVADINNYKSIVADYENKIYLVEDAAHAFGSMYGDSKIGNHTDATCFSFYATKNITTGEGGALLLKNRKLLEKAEKLAWHGINKDLWDRYSNKSEWKYDVEYPGYKFNMSDLNAALGLGQMTKVNEMENKRKDIAHKYNQEFKKIKNYVELPILENDYSENSYHLYVIKIKGGEALRDKFISYMKDNNIGVSVHFIPNHMQSYYKHKYNFKLINTEKVYNEIVSLPMYSSLSEDNISYIISTVLEFFYGEKKEGYYE